jgi:hypothetical protein
MKKRVPARRPSFSPATNPAFKARTPPVTRGEHESFWLTQRLHQVIEWVRKEEVDAATEREAERAKWATREAAGANVRPGYVERVVAATNDLEVVVWRGLRLLIIINLCIAASVMVGLIVVLLIAAQQVGVTQVGVVTGSAASVAATAGTIIWRVVKRRGRDRS